MGEPERGRGAEPPAAAEAGWGEARPRMLPRPTSSPALCAAGIVLIMWSIVASPVLAVFGGALFVAALVIWVRELIHERRTEREPGP